MSVFTMDGKEYNLWVTDLEREAQVTDTENSGRTNDYAMHRDIIGTFYNYVMTIRPHGEDVTDYDTFYEQITAPVESHDMVFPYGQETLSFKAYITSAKDKLIIRNGKNLWGRDGVSLNFIAMEPQRRRN